MRRTTLFVMVVFVLTASPLWAEIAGFKKFQVSEDTWMVRYVGNAFMGKLKVRKALLCKTAKLTLKEGYTYFALLEEGAGEQGGPVYITAVPNYFTGGATYIAGRSNFHTYEATAKMTGEPLNEEQKPAKELVRFWKCE